MINEDPRLKKVFPKPSMICYRRGKNLKDLLVRAKISTKRKSNRKINGFSRCGRGPFHMCSTCALIPKEGIKTHKCNRNNKIYSVSSSVTCLTENVIYRITCKKPQCKDFVYIGETKRRFCDRFSDHRGYVTRKCLDQVCGEHFNQKNHKYEDMLPMIIEKVLPKNDDFLRLRRERHWINTYESIQYGANKKS